MSKNIIKKEDKQQTECKQQANKQKHTSPESSKNHDKDKDRAFKLFFGNYQNFANIVNSVVFNGEPIVKVGDLSDGFTDNQYDNPDENPQTPDFKEKIRDVCKLWTLSDTKVNINIAYLGIENQSGIDPYILPRVMIYDASNIQKQMKTHNGSINSPITIVIYTGSEEWNCTTSLSKLCHNKEKLETLPNEYKKYKNTMSKIFNDYHFYFISLKDLTEKDLKLYKDDSNLVFTILMYYANSKGIDLSKILTLNQKVVEPDLVFPLLDAFSPENKHWTTSYKKLQEQNKEKITMCDVAKELMMMGEKNMEPKLTEKDNIILEKDKAISEKDKTISEKDKAISEKDKTISEQDKTISEQDKTIAELKAEIAKYKK